MNSERTARQTDTSKDEANQVLKPTGERLNLGRAASEKTIGYQREPQGREQILGAPRSLNNSGNEESKDTVSRQEWV